MALDERLRRQLEHAGRPADPSGVYEHLIRRRERRRIVRRIQAGGLAVVVIAGSIAAVVGLTRVFPMSQRGGVGADGVSNGLIAYASTDQVDGENGIPQLSSNVWVIQPDGTGSRLLATVPGSISGMEWSPDGSRLAMGTHPAGGGTVWIVNADGTDLHRLPEPGTLAWMPSWSPDGTQIAVAIDGASGSAIAVMDADGNVRALTEIGEAGWPDWSPDGRRIAFVGWGPEGNRQGWDVYVMNADGTGIENLTNSPTVDLEPDWSPDGDRILFRSRRDVVRAGPSDQPDELYVMNADGTEQTRLTHDVAIDQSPVWSPDGASIAFSSIDEQAETTSLVVMNTDGSDRRVLMDHLPGTMIAWQPILLEATTSVPVSPSATPTESPPPTPIGEDIGLGFPVCDVTSVSGEFVPGVTGSAYVATKMSDVGECPEIEEGAFQVIAVDVTGDGVADASSGPAACDPFCSAFLAMDVNGDGTDEFFVQNIQFRIAGLRLYEVRADPAEVFPVTVSPSGYPDGDLPPGAEPQLWIGGDGFRVDTLRCFETPGARVPRALVQTSASQAPPDSSDSVWRATEIWFALDPDGTVSILDVGRFDEPTDRRDPTFAQGNDLCGTALPYPYGED